MTALDRFRIFWEAPSAIKSPAGFISQVYLEALQKAGVQARGVHRCDIPETIMMPSNHRTEDAPSVSFKVGAPIELRDYFWHNSNVIGALLLSGMDLVDYPAVTLVNGLCDFIACPSNYTAAILRESGVFKPLYVWLPEMSSDNPPSSPRKRTGAGLTPYRFGWIGHGNTEGADLALKGFQTAFQRRSDVALIVCDLSGTLDGRMAAYDRRVIVLPPAMESVNRFFRNIDCLVRPYRYSDHCWFELKAQEAGAQIIVSGIGGALDVCRAANTYLVETDGAVPVWHLESARQAGFLRPPNRINPSFDHLVELLRRVPSHPIPGNPKPVPSGQVNSLLEAIESRIDSGVCVDGYFDGLFN